MGELYDLKKDPDERVNLIRAADSGPTVERLRAELLALMAATSLTPQNDTMPMDEDIKTELPAQRIR